jgi:hypothetical protein
MVFTVAVWGVLSLIRIFAFLRYRLKLADRVHKMHSVQITAAGSIPALDALEPDFKADWKAIDLSFPAFAYYGLALWQPLDASVPEDILEKLDEFEHPDDPLDASEVV